MAIRTYLAMTPEEIGAADSLPANPAWMACHFSPEGLTDLPETLPPHSLLILDDSVPPAGPELAGIPRQLLELCGTVDGLLLDFERPGDPGLAQLAQALSQALPCPVGVSESYAEGLSGPVFLTLVPPHMPLAEKAAPWQGRELWLELGPGSETVALTEKGAQITPGPPAGELPHGNLRLHCHYSILPEEDRVLFSLSRTNADMEELLEDARTLGVTRAVGLWQELSDTDAKNRSAP